MRHQCIMGALSAEAEVLNHQALQHGPLAGSIPNIRHPNIQRAEPTRLCKRCHSPRLGSLDDRLVDPESHLNFSNWTLPRVAFLRVSVVSGPRHESKSTSAPGEEQTRLPHQSPRSKMSMASPLGFYCIKTAPGGANKPHSSLGAENGASAICRTQI